MPSSAFTLWIFSAATAEPITQLPRPAAVAASKEMIGYARDHSVAESFAYLNALQPGVFSIEDIARAVAAGKDGPAPEFDDLAPIDPPIKP